MTVYQNMKNKCKSNKICAGLYAESYKHQWKKVKP